MVVFAIPLKSKACAHDWEVVTYNFNRTIRSIFNQRGSTSFRCIVACNEIPVMDYEYDERLEFIQLDTLTPSEWIEMARDKFWKLTVIAARIKELLDGQAYPEKGIYVMPVDADDLLSCHIAEWCEKHPDENGFVSKDGYVWNKGENWLHIYPKMYTYCGSCNIIKMYPDDLPEEYPEDSSLSLDQETAASLNQRYPIRFDHNVVVDYYEKIGKPFSVLPFRSTIYVLNTGDNISAIYIMENPIKDLKRFHPIASLRKFNILNRHLFTKTLRKEFGLE